MASEIQRMLDQVWQECVANSEPQTVVWSDPGDFDAWMKEAAQAPSPTPEVTVTPEMVNAGRAAAAKAGADHYISTFVLTPIYRAMAAVAPKEEHGADFYALYDQHRAVVREVAARDKLLAAANAEIERLRSMDPPWAAEVVPLTRFKELESELATLKRRLSERDASLIRAVKHG